MNIRTHDMTISKTTFSSICEKFIRSDPNSVGGGLRAAFSRRTPDGREERIGSSLLAITVFISGLLLALCFCWMSETMIMSHSLTVRLALADNISVRPPSFVNAKIGRGIEGLSEINPFGALMLPAAGTKTDNSSYSATSLMLIGTLPNVGAWIRDDTGTHFILKGQEIRGYNLADIAYGRVLVTKNGDNYPLYLTLSSGKTVSPSLLRPDVNDKKTGPDLSAIEPSAQGKEGSVPRELIDKLLMNPYDEIGKMRMVPAEGGGMRLQRIAPDSVLGLLGVEQGDIIKAVNGVTISNLSDVTNAVNSMMSGSRFDVTVGRGGNSLELKYQVK